MGAVSFIGFDFGLKQIGVAYGQAITKTAKPLGVVRVNSGVVDWDSVTSLNSEWQPDAFIVGLPLNMDGSEQKFHPQLVHFKKELSKRYGKDVHWCDERLSTVSARSELYEFGGKKALKKDLVDAKSAQIILEQWLFENS